MPAPDRLAELQRQRALIQQHLAWLDREIAAAERRPIAAPSDAPQALPSPAVPSALPAGRDATTAELEAEAEAVMAEYRLSSTDVQRDVRRGCFIYAAAGFLLFVAVVAGLYFALRH
jgi:hypothetical protein